MVRERTDSPIYNEVKLENVVLTKLLSIPSIKLFNYVTVFRVRSFLQLKRTFKH